MRGEVQTGRPEVLVAGDRGARSVQGRGLGCRLGAGHGEERTLNISSMVVTLEVSKLSGWLNADALCRESNGGHAVRDEGAGQQTGATVSGVQWRLSCRFRAEQAWSAPRTYRTCS